MSVVSFHFSKSYYFLYICVTGLRFYHKRFFNLKYIFAPLIIFLIGCSNGAKKELPETEEYANLIGQWTVTASDFSPFEHLSYCNKLGVDSVFDFDKFGMMKVYDHQNTKEACNQDQKYWIKEDKLVIFEDDFGFDYKIVSLSSNKMILHTDHVPTYLFENDPANGDQVSSDIAQLQEKGITIQLIKRK